MRVDLKLESKIERSARVVQMEGIFDVPAAEKTAVEFHFDAPIEERPWQVGLIVGPSGAGKSSVARAMFPADAHVDGYEWPARGAVVDGFGKAGIRDITAALSSVGFSSPPAWVRPFAVLSNGEKFRATMARMLMDERPLVVLDEYSSVVDRQAAQVGSWALQKAVRANPGKQFVAVTCHYDVVDWLQPDWTLEPHVGRFTWRLLQRRPSVGLEVVRVAYPAWRWFAPHHYLTADLTRSARCFVGLVDGTPAAFAGVLPMPHAVARNLWGLSRVVVLPEFQGLGLGAGSFTTTIARIVASVGGSFGVVTSHPAMIHALARSTLWHMAHPPAFANKPGRRAAGLGYATTTRRRAASFRWRGGAFEAEADRRTARAMWN